MVARANATPPTSALVEDAAPTRSYLQPGAELTMGLDVINSTNLNYFNPGQKAEFFCLKGLFLQRLAAVQEEQRPFLNERASEGVRRRGWLQRRPQGGALTPSAR